MKFLVFGAGAVGTYVGGSLVLAGHTVCFLATPPSARLIRERGLRLDLRAGAKPDLAGAAWWGEEVSLGPARFAVAGSLEEALRSGDFDVSVFALKTYHAAAAMEAVLAAAAPMPPVLCLSNGVETEAVIGRALGAQRVIAGALTTAVSRRGPGEVAVESRRGVALAAQPGISEALAAALNAAGLNARTYADANSMKWSKLLLNLLTNPTAAILDMRPSEILAHDGLYRLEMRMLRECLAVMKALGLRVLNLPGAPVGVLAWMAGMPPRLSAPFIRRSVGLGRGGKMPSLHVDLHSGRGQSEVVSLHGAVARVGAEHGIATPVNRSLTEILLGLVSGEISTDEYARLPEKLIARIEAIGALRANGSGMG